MEFIEKHLKDEEKLRVIKKVYEENKEEIEEEVRKYKEKQAEKPYWATEEKAIQELKDLNQTLFLDQYFNAKKVFLNLITGKSKKEKKSEATEDVYFIRDYVISDEYLNAKKVVEEEICKYIIACINRNEKINEKKVIDYMERNFYDIFNRYKVAEKWELRHLYIIRIWEYNNKIKFSKDTEKNRCFFIA